MFMEFIHFYVSSFWVFLGITIGLLISLSYIINGIIAIVKIIALTVINNKRKENKE